MKVFQLNLDEKEIKENKLKEEPKINIKYIKNDEFNIKSMKLKEKKIKSEEKEIKLKIKKNLNQKIKKLI